MNTFLHFFIFIIVLFLYVHITGQFKKSEDLEVYEMDYTTNSNLQEVCHVKQPILFEYKSIHPDFFENINDEKLAEMELKHDIRIKEIDDYWMEKDSVDYIFLPFQSSQTLMTSDTNSRYFTENNEDFIVESGISSHFQSNDAFFKPPMTLQTKYDLCTGSKDVITPLRYHTFFRHFICVNSGKIKVMMTPFKSSRNLYPIHDYTNYEFWSPVNCWKPQKKYLHEMDKLKFLEFDVIAGNVLYVPPYWWYSIKYIDSDTCMTSFTYNSIINCLANSVNIGRYYLQQSNMKNKIMKTLDIEKTDEKNDQQKELDTTTNVK